MLRCKMHSVLKHYFQNISVVSFNKRKVEIVLKIFIYLILLKKKRLSILSLVKKLRNIFSVLSQA